LADKGVKVFDLSADYRINDAAIYEEAYKLKHLHKDWLTKAVYGLAEIFTDNIKSAELVAVPGCYPTSILIPLIPLLRADLIDHTRLIADSKSGVSGAGKKATMTTHFCEANEDFKPYGIMTHRHRPEIDNIIGRASGKRTHICFTPHLVPMNRGMISTIYSTTKASKAELLAAWHKAYDDKPFVRIREDGSIPSVKYVANTPYVDIALYTEETEYGTQVIIVSALDNLLKGASSQAMQCFNIRMGFDEGAGLR
ncbi:MAG: N-acetyl-gamma-glutamyl-phosphate reductase, partial [Deferribacteraceae bacterium]|nr:N-acetyl-gamma-glutamyl-phosphate reductase [Deferribacteraceae bacterium]